MDSFYLNNGAKIAVYQAQEVGGGLKQYLNGTNYSLTVETGGELIALLTIRNGQNLKGVYNGEICIEISPAYQRMGIEKVLMRKLSQWLNHMGNVYRAKLGIRVSDLIALELLMDIFNSSRLRRGLEHEFIRAV